MWAPGNPRAAEGAAGVTRAPLIDTHCHLADPAFADDLDAVLERARAAGVIAMIALPTDVVSSQAVIALAERYPDVWAAVGVHPNDCAGLTRADFAAIEALAQHPRVVAIGESGLDYYRDRAAREQQRTVLRWHAELAQRVSKPLVIHNREADADLATDLAALYRGTGSGAGAGVLHCYSSDPALALGLFAVGFCVSFGGNLTFKRADGVRAAARAMPLDRVLIETDAPYLAPEPRRGRRCEPADVATTADYLAGLLGLDRDTVGRVTTANAQRLFFGEREAGYGGELPPDQRPDAPRQAEAP